MMFRRKFGKTEEPWESGESSKVRREGSLDALSKIYYILAGLAVTEAIKRAALPVPEGTQDWEVHRFWILILFISVAIRFTHGAATHFGTHKRPKDPTGWYARRQPLLDFVCFGGQAGFMVVFGLNLHSYVFFYWLALLFIWDEVWIAITLKLDPAVDPLTLRTMRQWLWSDAFLYALLVGAYCLPVIVPLSQAQSWVRGLLISILGGTAFWLDYRMNGDYYFGRPAAAPRPGRKSMRRVVVESSYAGEVHEIPDKVAYAQKAVHDCLKRGEAPIASHLLFTQRGLLLDSKMEQRDLGIAAGHAWIPSANAVVVYVDLGVSSGMGKGITAAVLANVPVEFRSLQKELSPAEREDYAAKWVTSASVPTEVVA